MKDVAVAVVNGVVGVASMFIVASFFVGADTLVPHRYVIIKDGQKIGYTNKT